MTPVNSPGLRVGELQVADFPLSVDMAAWAVRLWDIHRSRPHDVPKFLCKKPLGLSSRLGTWC